MAEKKLPDITRRQFLKGAAKVAGATALPGSGLASIGEAVEKPLTINQKLDLTKNVMEQLSKLKVTPRQNKILLFLENEYYRRESNKRASLKEKGKTYQYYLDPEVAEEYLGEFDSLFAPENFNALFEAEGNASREIQEVIDIEKQRIKLHDIIQEYNLPFNSLINYAEDYQYRYIEPDKPKLLDNFNKIKKNYLEDYNKVKSLPNQEVLVNDKNKYRLNKVEEYINSEKARSLENKIMKKYNLNRYQVDYLKQFPSSEQSDAVLGPKVLKDDFNLTSSQLDEPLFQEYFKLENRFRPAGVHASNNALNSFSQQQNKEKMKIGTDIINDLTPSLNTKKLEKNVKQIANKEMDEADLKKLVHGTAELDKNNVEQKPKAIEGPKLSDTKTIEEPKLSNTQTIEGEAKRIPEPEGLEVEVEDVEEIQQKNPVLAQRIVNLLGKSIRRSPYVFGLTPTKMGDAELNIKDKQGNLIPRRKGGTVMRNYNKNYNTQRTI